MRLLDSAVCVRAASLDRTIPGPDYAALSADVMQGPTLGSHPATFVLKHHHHRHSTETLCSPLFARLGQLHSAPKIPVRRGLHVLSYTPPPQVPAGRAWPPVSDEETRLRLTITGFEARARSLTRRPFCQNLPSYSRPDRPSARINQNDSSFLEIGTGPAEDNMPWIP